MTSAISLRQQLLRWLLILLLPLLLAGVIGAYAAAGAVRACEAGAYGSSPG